MKLWRRTTPDRGKEPEKIFGQAKRSRSNARKEWSKWQAANQKESRALAAEIEQKICRQLAGLQRQHALSLAEQTRRRPLPQERQSSEPQPQPPQPSGQLPQPGGLRRRQQQWHPQQSLSQKQVTQWQTPPSQSQKGQQAAQQRPRPRRQRRSRRITLRRQRQRWPKELSWKERIVQNELCVARRKVEKFM